MSLCPLPREVVYLTVDAAGDFYIPGGNPHEKHFVIQILPIENIEWDDRIRLVFVDEQESHWDAEGGVEFEITVHYHPEDQSRPQVVYNTRCSFTRAREYQADNAIVMFNGQAVNTVSFRYVDPGSELFLMVMGGCQLETQYIGV